MFDQIVHVVDAGACDDFYCRIVDALQFLRSFSMWIRTRVESSVFVSTNSNIFDCRGDLDRLEQIQRRETEKHSVYLFILPYFPLIRAIFRLHNTCSRNRAVQPLQ